MQRYSGNTSRISCIFFIFLLFYLFLRMRAPLLCSSKNVSSILCVCMCVCVCSDRNGRCMVWCGVMWYRCVVLYAETESKSLKEQLAEQTATITVLESQLQALVVQHASAQATLKAQFTVAKYVNFDQSTHSACFVLPPFFFPFVSVSNASILLLSVECTSEENDLKWFFSDVWFFCMRKTNYFLVVFRSFLVLRSKRYKFRSKL